MFQLMPALSRGIPISSFLLLQFARTPLPLWPPRQPSLLRWLYEQMNFCSGHWGMQLAPGRRCRQILSGEALPFKFLLPLQMTLIQMTYSSTRWALFLFEFYPLTVVSACCIQVCEVHIEARGQLWGLLFFSGDPNWGVRQHEKHFAS